MTRSVSGLFLLVVLAAAGVAAQQADDPAQTIVVIEARRAELAAEAAAAQSDEEADGLARLDGILVRRIDALRRRADVSAESEAALAALSDPPQAAVEKPPPHPLATLDEWSAAVERERDLATRLRGALVDAEAALQEALGAAESAESRRRKHAEAAGEASPELEVESRIAHEQVELRRDEVASTRARIELHRLRERRAADVRDHVAKALALSAEDRAAALAPLDARAKELGTAIDELRRKLDAAAKSGKEATQDTTRRELAFLTERLARVHATHRTLERRYQVLAGEVPSGELAAWFEEARDQAAALEREQRLKLAGRVVLADEFAAAAREGVPRTEIAALRRIGRVADLDLTELQEARAHARQLVEHLAPILERRTFGERLQAARNSLESLWNYEITSSDDRPITLGKIVRAILVFGIGYLIALTLSRLIGRRALPQLGFDAGGAHAIEVLGFYGLLVIAFLVALRTVNIPLTAFAVAGGAVAIGVGFGSQNVVSNFISGLILLAERPIKIGDLVEVDDTYGNVERIGLRSTRVRTGENIHVIVPNALFLENKVTNWTLQDERVRISLAVGVIYGSPTDRVDALIRRAIVEHPRALPKPAPVILFADFGDDSLMFEAHFWIRMKAYLDRRIVLSDVRYRIDALFREAGLVIAFPQRDVHLDTANPLEIRLVDTPEGRRVGPAQEDA